MSLMLSSLPMWASALIVVVIPTLASMGGLLLVRRIFGLERLVTNNEVAGFKFAVVGVTYAVLLGFAVIVVERKRFRQRWTSLKPRSDDHALMTAAVERRGADMVAFQLIVGDGDELLAAIERTTR